MAFPKPADPEAEAEIIGNPERWPLQNRLHVRCWNGQQWECGTIIRELPLVVHAASNRQMFESAAEMVEAGWILD